MLAPQWRNEIHPRAGGELPAPSRTVEARSRLSAVTPAPLPRTGKARKGTKVRQRESWLVRPDAGTAKAYRKYKGFRIDFLKAAHRNSRWRAYMTPFRLAAVTAAAIEVLVDERFANRLRSDI